MAVLEQVGMAALFYFLVIALFRIAGKRFAGQTTTFDLVILISLSVALQQITLKDGMMNAAIFVVTVFGLHLAVAQLCVACSPVRYFLRGKPRNLVYQGEILHHALRAEHMSLDELLAGLRKLGIEDVSKVASAHLEETGQISAIEIK